MSSRISVDHLTVSPAALFLAAGETQQLTATTYDINNSVLTGRTVLWSSSNPDVADVNALTGLVMAVALGICTITATCEGRTAIASTTVTVPLTLTLDWAPLLRRTDLADPLVLVSNTGLTGYQDGIPQHLGSGLLSDGANVPARASYPKTATEWGFVAMFDGPMSKDRAPDAPHVTANTLITGPYPNTGARSLVPNDAALHYAILDSAWNSLPSADNQDGASFKRSLGCVLIATTPDDVGETVRVNLIDTNNYPSGGNWNSATQPVIKFVDVVLQHSLAEVDHTAATASLWEHVALTFDSHAQQSAVVEQPVLAVTMVPNSGNLVSYAVAPYQARSWQDEGDSDPSNWLRPMPFHETLGVLSTDIYCNCWPEDCDMPTLYAAAARASTAIAAPDSERFFGGRTLSQYTLGIGDGISPSALVRIEDGGDSPPALSNIPTASAWLHWYISPAAGHVLPGDTDLAAYLIASGLASIAEDTVQRPDNSSSPGTMDTGQEWNPLVGTWQVLGNMLGLTDNIADALLVVDCSVSDCTVDATFAHSENASAVIGRLTNASNYWYLEWESGTLFLYKVVAGSFDLVVSTTLPLVSGDRLGLILSGNSISPTYNGTIVSALVTSDAFNVSATTHGIGANQNYLQTSVSYFKVSHQSSNAPTYGPTPLERDSTRYGLSNGSPLVAADGSQFYRCRIPINRASEGYLDFTAKIVNASAGQLVFNAYRAAITTEGDRGMGLHSAWVPKRTITGRQFGDSCFETIPNIQVIMTTPTLVWVIRQVLPWSPGDLENLNGAGTSGYQPSLWQSGPYGTADFTFHCDIQPHYDRTVAMDIEVGRGSPTADPEDYMSWHIQINNMSIGELATAWPRFVAHDIAVVAQDGIPLALGIGLGTGTDIQWLDDGDTFCGGTVRYQDSAGLPWTFDGAGYNDSGHMGLAADLDRVRQTNGWFQAIAAGITVDPANVKNSVMRQIAHVWGARQDYRQ